MFGEGSGDVKSNLVCVKTGLAVCASIQFGCWVFILADFRRDGDKTHSTRSMKVNMKLWKGFCTELFSLLERSRIKKTVWTAEGDSRHSGSFNAGDSWDSLWVLWVRNRNSCMWTWMCEKVKPINWTTELRCNKQTYKVASVTSCMSPFT